jgi:hypothetical protein
LKEYQQKMGKADNMGSFDDFFHQLSRSLHKFYYGLNYWSTMFLFLFLALFFCGLLSSFLRVISVIIRKCGRCCSVCCKPRRSVRSKVKHRKKALLNPIPYHTSGEQQQKGYDHSPNAVKNIHEKDDPKSSLFVPVYRTPPREERTKIIFETVLILPQYHRESTEMERTLPSAPAIDNMVSQAYDTRSMNNNSQHMDHMRGVTQAYVVVPNSSVAYEDNPYQVPSLKRSTSQMSSPSSPSQRNPNYFNNKDYIV